MLKASTSPTSFVLHHKIDRGQRFARYASTPQTRPAAPNKQTNALKNTAASSLSGDQNRRPLANRKLRNKNIATAEPTRVPKPRSREMPAVSSPRITK